jgi:transposase
MKKSIPEYGTSKNSACCHTQMEGLLVEGTRHYGVRVCTNNACPRTVWDRNTSAAINILNLFLAEMRGEERPACFSRQQHHIDEADLVEAEAVAVDIN